MNIKKAITGAALAVVCLVAFPACGGGGGGGGGGNGGGTQEKPSESGSTPTETDYAPNIFNNLKMTGTAGDWFRIWAGNSGSARYGTSGLNNNYYDGYYNYRKTGVNTASLQFKNMRLDYGMGVYVTMNFDGTLEFSSETKVYYSGSLTTQSSANGTRTIPFSGTYTITKD